MRASNDPVANLTAINQRIATAATAAERNPAEVTLVVVSKTYAAAAVRPILLAGHRCFGENRVQEAREKWAELTPDFPDTRLHLIGPLQTNKVRDAVGLFDVIETVDRPKLARVLAAEMARAGRFPHCLIQVNVGQEPQKAGVDPKDADALIALAIREYALPVIGVMGIPPLDQPSESYFKLLLNVAQKNNLKVVSMGMSSDFEAAISCGATHVRVGSAIFGDRAK